MEKDRNRHELKYYISRQYESLLRNRLIHVLKPDANMNGALEYTVSSLYFDDIYDTAYNEKQEGLQTRTKYRIRIYNGEDSLIRLEKKSKDGAATNKQSCKLTKDEYYRILSGSAANPGDKQAPPLNGFYRDMVMRYLRPKVIVEYDREALICDASELRITFDRHLRVSTNTFDLFERSNTRCFVLPEDMTILEVKFNCFLPDYIRGILAMVDSHSLAISKYVLCREKLNEIKEL